jgi:Ca-activated chloride channel family protein
MINRGPCLRTVPCRLWSLVFASIFLAVVSPVIGAQSSNADAAPLVGTTAGPARAGVVENTATRAKPVRVDVDLVEVPVTVTDPLNRTVIGLAKDCFTLLDNGRPQQIQFFSEEDSPLSIALVLDVSNSMTTKIIDEGQALGEFLKNAHPNDEYFAIAVSDQPIPLAGSGEDVETIQARLGSLKPSGYTALIDSVYLAIQRLQHARYRRRAILIISDGGDNNSRYSLRQIRNVAIESDVLIYAIRTVSPLPILGALEAKLGNRVLATIAESTGGRTVSITASNNLPQAAAEISWELRHQYLLGYRPTDVPRDGQPHRVQVRVRNTLSNKQLQAHYRPAYRAPAN